LACRDETIPVIEMTNCTENLHPCAAIPGKTSVTNEHDYNHVISNSKKNPGSPRPKI